METNKKGAKLAIVVIIAYLLIPLAMTLIYSLFEEWIDVLPKRFTLTAYMEIFSDPVFWRWQNGTDFHCAYLTVHHHRFAGNVCNLHLQTGMG